MRRLAAPVAIVFAIAIAWIAALPAASSRQPMAFNHSKHASAGCVVCHAGVETAESASLPQISTCAKCHATAPRTINAAQWDGSVKTGRIDWVKVTRLPAHVMFSHRRHVAIGRLDCAACHADIGSTTTPVRRAPVRLEMKTCLGCHQQEAASQDCAACHR